MKNAKMNENSLLAQYFLKGRTTRR